MVKKMKVLLFELFIVLHKKQDCDAVSQSVSVCDTSFAVGPQILPEP